MTRSPLLRLLVWPLSLGIVLIAVALVVLFNQRSAGSRGSVGGQLTPASASTKQPVPTPDPGVSNPAPVIPLTPPPDIPALDLQLPPAPMADDAPPASLMSLEEAQARVDFTILVPATLPQGYRFLGVMPVPQLPAHASTSQEPPLQMVTLLFANESGQNLTLTQMRLTRGGDLRPPPAADQSRVQRITVNDAPAYYVQGSWTRTGWKDDDSRRLYWLDKSGVMYDLTGVQLELSDLLRMAQTLK